MTDPRSSEDHDPGCDQGAGESHQAPAHRGRDRGLGRRYPMPGTADPSMSAIR